MAANTAGERPTSGGDLATLLSDMAQLLQQEPDVQATLQRIVEGAVALVPGAEHASLSSIIKRREMHTRASSGELPQAVDRAQGETGQGPCLDTLYEQRTAQVPVMAEEQRWPDFAGRARALGVESMLAVQLFVEGDDMGPSTSSALTRNPSTRSPSTSRCSSRRTPPSPCPRLRSRRI